MGQWTFRALILVGLAGCLPTEQQPFDPLRTAERQVVGGEPEQGYPFVGFMLPMNCTAVLIRSDVVLTAAHCVRNTLREDGGFYGFALGNLPNARPYRVRKVITHPFYRYMGAWDLPENDIAVVLLKDAVDGVEPAELGSLPLFGDADPQCARTVYRGVGYGRDTPGWGMFPVEDAPLPRRSLQLCVKGRNPGNQVILAAPRAGGSTCDGDSGGGLFVEGTRSLIGLVSYGPTDCGKSGEQVVTGYTSVLIHRRFIDDSIGAPACPCRSGYDDFCSYGPTPGCPMTEPGGYCDPLGDGSQRGADGQRAHLEYRTACLDGLQTESCALQTTAQTCDAALGQLCHWDTCTQACRRGAAGACSRESGPPPACHTLATFESCAAAGSRCAWFSCASVCRAPNASLASVCPTGALSAPAGLAPAGAFDAPAQVNGAVTLSWSPVPEATGYEVGVNYQDPTSLQWSYRVASSQVTGTSWSPALPHATGLYSWAVRASHASRFGPYSSYGYFRRVEVGPPTRAPAELTPGSTQVQAPAVLALSPLQLFSWSSVPGATQYELQFSYWDEGQWNPLTPYYVASQTAVVDLPGGRLYGWRVRGAHSGGAGPWSVNVYFRN